MNRRDFLNATAAGFALLCSESPLKADEKEYEKLYETIFAVQRHLFPKGLEMPDADSFGASAYFKDAIWHKSFDPDIRALLFEGARRVDRLSEGRFHSFAENERETILRKFEEDSFGSYWLVQLMNITLEALFSDPLYGGNIDMAGWKTFGLKPPHPRPKERYCGV